MNVCSTNPFRWLRLHWPSTRPISSSWAVPQLSAMLPAGAVTATHLNTPQYTASPTRARGAASTFVLWAILFDHQKEFQAT